MPTVRERIEGRNGSLDSDGFVFFPYQLLGSSGGSSGGSGGPTGPGSTTIRTLTPEELEAILAGGGGRLETNDEPPEVPPGSGGSGGPGGGGTCISLGAGFLFAPSGRYQRKFHVVSSACEPLLNARSARDATGIPKLGDPFPVDPFALVVSKNAESEPDDPQVWYIVVEYSREGNPLLNPWDISWHSTTFTVAATKDKDGLPIQNSAGHPFDPPAEVEERRFTLSLTRNVASYSTATAAGYCDTVNAAPVRIADLLCAPRTLKVVSWAADSFEYLGKRYWRETLVVEYDANEHTLKLANVGYMDRNRRPYSREGFVGHSPVPLNPETGEFLNPGENIAYKTFKVYPEKDFCPLFLNYGN